MMKTRITRISKRSLSMILALLMMFSTLMVGTMITANAWGVQGGHKVYFVNTGGWTSVYHHFWGSNWNNWETMTQVSGTGIYYKNYSNDYTADGFNFMSSQSQSGGTSGRTDWVTSNVAYSGDNNMNYETDLTKLNGTAKVISMVSTGGNYTQTASSNCVATISSINLSGGATSTSSTSGSTGSSSSEASCYPAYGASVSYSATDSGDYVFMGFSTTSSTSLPNDATTSYSNRISMGFNGGSNLSNVYAYFMKKYAVTTVGGSYGTLSASPTEAIKGASVTLTATVTNPNYSFNGVNITKTSDSSAVTTIAASSFSNTTSGGTYNYTMPGYAVTATSQYTIKTGTVSVSKDSGIDSYTITAGGSTISSGDTVNAGTAIVITPTYKTGYEPASTSYTISGTVTGATANSAGVLSFTTSSGSNVTASLKSKKIDYTVSKNSPSNGSVSLSKTSANYQDSITVTLTPNADYKVGTITVKDASNNPITTTKTQGGGVDEVTKYTFDMPASNVTVNVSFTYGYVTYSGVHASYTVTGTDPGNISVSPTTGANIQANIGQSITASAAPSGYTFTGWTSTDGTFANANALSTTFYPTANNATAVAQYVEDSHTITVSAGTGGSVTQTSITAHPVTTYALSGIGASANTGYYFSGWTKGSGVTLSGNSSSNPNVGTLIANQNSTLQANFTAYSHSISYGGSHTSYTAKTTSGVLNQVIRIYVKADTGYSLGTPTVTRNGSGITVTKDSSDTTHSGYTCYYFTVPAVSDETPITVTTNATAITPTISVTYQNGESSTTTASSGSKTTTARGNKTITFTNPSSYPNGTVFHIYDGSTSIYNSTVGGTYAKTTTLSAGTHTLKVVVTLDNAQINSATVTLTVNAYHTVTVKSPTYGGRVTINYVGDWSSNSTTASSPTAGNTNTVYVKDGTNATVVRYTSSTNELANVYVDGVAQTVTSNSATISSITADHAITADFYSSNWGLRGEDTSVGLNWNSSLKFRYTETENVLQATLTYSSAINTAKKFKVYDSNQSGDSAWYTNSSLNATADVSDIQFSNTETGYDTNALYTPNVKGTYTFKFNSSTNKFSLEYPGLSITLGAHNNATVSQLPSDAKAGDEIAFVANPDTGYVITGITYTTNAAGTTTENATFDVQGGAASFSMPNVNTTVAVTTKSAYTVTFAKGSHVESLSAVYTAYSDDLTSGEYVGKSDTVTFSAVLAEGYSVNTSSLPSGYSGYSATLNSSNKYEVTFTKTVTSAVNFTLSASAINYTLNTGSNTSYGGTVKFKKNSSSANSVTSDSSMTVESTFYPDVTANTTSGYQLDSIELRKAGTTTTISEYDSMSSGSQYSMPAYNSTLYATWSAIKPAMASISSSTSGVTVSGYTITAYAGQSIEITPAVTAASYGVISYGKGNVTGKTDALMATYNSTTKKFTFTVPEDIGSLASSTAQYQFKIRPKNSPSEVDAVWGSYKTITINVSYSATQQAYINLKSKYEEYYAYGITSDDIESGWNTVGNVIGYGSAMDAAATAIANFPAWNATDIYSSKQTDLEGAYSRLVFKTNTIYVLSKYEHSNSSYVNIYLFNNSTATHDPSPIFYTDTSLTTINNTARNYHMTYEGETNDHKHLYSFTYRGHQEFIIYRQSSETNTLTGGAKLTGDIDLRNTTNYPYGEYYIDVKNTDVTSSPSVTSASTFTDFSISATGADSDLMVGQCKEGATGYTVSQIKDWLGITFNGSLASTSSQTVAQTYTITGPVGRGVSTTATVDSDNNWVPLKPGRYTVSLDASLGTDGRASAGATFTGAKSTVGDTQTVLDLFVAFDDIEIYADMNGNVGTPTIHFTYTDNHEQDADLPYEFDMVTGSESIYSYTISVSTLKDVYHIDLLNGAHTEGGITYRAAQVSKISIDSVDIENSSFSIARDAARTGTLWLKADSSNMKTFNKIAYGSSTRTFKAVLRNGNTDTDFNNTFAEVNGTGIITDELVGDSYQYTSFYAAKDATANYDFSYTLRAKAQTDITHKDGNTTNYYYFDHWESINGTTTNTNPTEASGTDVNILKAPNYATDADVTYVAVYKLTSTQKRVEITYKFKDYDTDDENYVYDPDKPLKDATYTKTVNWNGTTALSTVAQNSCPIIKSNYFDYTFDASTANVTKTQSEDPNTHKTCITAELKQTPHKYKIILGSTTHKGYYQQSVALTAAGSNYKWYVKDANNNMIVIGNGQTYNARFGVYQDASSETESGVSYQYDICTIYNESGTAAINSSIVPAHQEVYYDNDTPKVRHNFFIIDAYDNSGEFVGAGVLYATTYSSGNYRQSNAATVLGSTNSVNTNGISNFITGVLNPNNNINTAKYNTEFKAQTINNIGFRYLPYSGNESIIRYSNELKAYMYTFAGENTNSESLNGQKLRVFSFFVYKNGSTYTNVVSNMYAQVERYIPQS